MKTSTTIPDLGCRFFAWDDGEYKIDRGGDGSAVGMQATERRRGDPPVPEAYASMRVFTMYEREQVADVERWPGDRAAGRRKWMKSSHVYLPNDATYADALCRFMGPTEAAKILVEIKTLD